MLPDDARAVRLALRDPRALCAALGLLGGRGGHQLQARGIIIRCLWHRERTPSCSVYRATDGTIAFRCHGCGQTGDALSLIAAAMNVDLRASFGEVLAEAARIGRVQLSSPTPPSTGKRAAPPAPAPTPAPAAEVGAELLDDSTFAAVADLVLDLCPIEADPEAWAYVERRGVAPLAASWGAIPATAAGRAEVRQTVVALLGEDAWLRCGLARTDGPRRGDILFADHRLVIPWRAPGIDGAVVALQRRLLRAPRAGEPKYVSPRGRAPQHPFGVEDAAEELGDGVDLCIVEGALDTLAMRLLSRRHGLSRAVVGIPGVEHWGRHAEALASLVRGRGAIVALDADAAGERHVGALAAALVRAGATRVHRSRPTAGKDWCDVLLTNEVM
jgi:DNA primase